MEQALVERAGLTFEAIEAAALRGKNPVAALGGLLSLGRGYRQSRRIIERFKPDAVFVTGGYVCAPVTLAARRAGVPVVIYLPDIEPGLAIRFLARFARRVAVSAAESRDYFRPGQAVVTGYPVRPDLLAADEAARRAAARHRFDLAADWPVLLVFGGSRGARSINRAVAQGIEALLGFCQVIHVTGSLDESWVRDRAAQLSPDLGSRYRVWAYLHETMIDALWAADLVVSRAGASVLGEFPAVGLPAILVPYPYAGAHQNVNADYLARHQAGIVIQDNELDQTLIEQVGQLITNREKLQAMQQASKNLARPEAASHLAQLIVEVGSYARS